MRIALLLDPPAHWVSASAWVREASKAEEASLVMLPTADPLVRALANKLVADTPNDSGVVVLARAAIGHLEDSEWDELGLEGRAPLLAPSDEALVESTIAEASAHFDRGDLERARLAYAGADALLAADNGPRRAEVLVCLADIEATRGEAGASASLLDRALAIFPDHQTALHKRIELARASADAATAAALRRRLLKTTQTDDERATLLSSIADDSLVATAEALQQALAIRPRDPRLLERLQAVMEAAGRWREAVDTKVALSETIENPRDRARSLSAAAGMCARRTNDVMRAVALYEAAIADDPTSPGAFEAIEAVLVKNDDWHGVERAYARQLERLTGRRETDAEASLLDKLASLRSERLADPQGAIEALDRLVVTKPADVEPRARLAGLLEKNGDLALAAHCLEAAASCAPTRPETFRDLYRVSTRLGDLDRSYCSCAVLVHLGEAELDEQMLYQRFAPETTPRPRAALDARGWTSLYVDEHAEAVSRVVHAVAPAAIALRLEQLRAARRLPEPQKRDRQYVEKSTLTAVRSIGFSCALLGMPVPEIYAKNEELPGGLAHLPTQEPALLIGKALLSGRSVPELVFATARELACQQLTSRLLTFYPSLIELRAVTLAAIAQVLPMSLERDAMGLREALRARLDARQKSALEHAVGALHGGDGRLDLNEWLRAVELAACRAGLLACGDITAAARMLALDGRVVGRLSAAERVRDLIPFSVSEKYGALRRALGVEAQGST